MVSTRSGARSSNPKGSKSKAKRKADPKPQPSTQLPTSVPERPAKRKRRTPITNSQTLVDTQPDTRDSPRLESPRNGPLMNNCFRNVGSTVVDSNPTGNQCVTGTNDSSVLPNAPTQNSRFSSQQFPSSRIPDRSDPDFPKLENFREKMCEWPPGRIRKYLQANRTNLNNRPSEGIQTEAKLAYQRYEHTLLMLALVGKISEKTVKNYLPEPVTKRKKGAYTLYRRYGKKALEGSMPARGKKDGILSDRNRRNGQGWTSLENTQKKVFSPKVLFALAGLPIPREYLISNKTDHGPEEEGSKSTNQIPKLSLEDEALYRPIYETMVDERKVLRQLTAKGPSSTKPQKQGAKFLKGIASDLMHQSKEFDMAYYLLGVSTSIPSKAQGPSWSMEYSSHPQVGKWANNEYGFRRGSSIAEAIATGAKDNAGLKNNNTSAQPSDVVKGELANLLRILITKANNGIKPPQSFPQTSDPQAALLARKLDFKILQEDNSTLTHEALDKGFRGMTTKERRCWIDDLKRGFFRLQRLGEDGEEVELEYDDIAKYSEDNQGPRTYMSKGKGKASDKGNDDEDKEDRDDIEDDDEEEEEEEEEYNDDDDDDDDDGDDDDDDDEGEEEEEED
ncbi:hypothetical protein DFH28DRAFT_1161830 [Melampsora americana]|nr:hypothetical protein DFH28DRAFT_1161830 [Melampsora americana]